MPQHLKATDDADLLAAVPVIAGYHTRNSIVCVLFRGRYTLCAFRVDLPRRHRHADYKATVDGVIQLAKTAGAEFAVPVIYTDRSFEQEHGIPWPDFAKMLNERMHRAGLHLHGSFCVAADGWRSYFETGGPRSLEEIAASTLAADLPEVADLGTLGELPAFDAEIADGIDAAFDRLPDDVDPIDHVEDCLATEPDFMALATFVELAQSPANRDVMVVQIAFGRVVGEALADDNAAYHAIQAETGLSMDDVVRAEVAAGRRDLDDELSALLWGKGRVRPDIDRINRTIAWLRTATANVPTTLQPPLLCMLGWLCWARGLGSVAGAYVDEALEIDPYYGMADLLDALLASGRVPDWALPQAD